ncbi:hypothetical protein AAIG78_004071 [Escherichia coli]|nr:hypothetical protein [Escherichia coli]
MHVRSRGQDRGLGRYIVVREHQQWECRVATRGWRATAAASGYAFC